MPMVNTVGMKNKQISLQTFLVTLIFLSVGCKSSQNSEKNLDADTVPLQNSMHSFKESLTKLLPIVIDPKQFNAQENQAQIEAEVKRLRMTSTQVTHNPTVQMQDPSLGFISSAFSEDLKRAEEALDLGKREFARYTLMNMTAYCIECHTRTSSGPSFQSEQLEKSLGALKKVDRGEFLLSTRQFDKAFRVFKDVIEENLSQGTNLFDVDRAVRYAMAIAIKYERSPDKALQVIQLIESSDKTPFYLKQSTRSWSVSLQDWKKEKKKSAKSAAELLKRCRDFVAQGRIMQTGVSERSGDVLFLRALSDLHIVMAMNLTKEQLGEALYLTGVSYETVRDLAVWSLHESYYESCIRRVPHSKWSEKCYQRLEESVYFGYSGSGGLKLPIDVQVHLQDLQKLATPDR